MWAWLLAIAGPLAIRVLSALGIGFVTYGGLTLVANQVRDQVLSGLSGLSGSAYQVIAMTGIFESIGIMLGALSARATLMAISKIGRITSPAP